MLAQLPPLPPGIRLLKDGEIARLRDRNPTIPSGPSHCVTCDGKGEFLWWDRERTTTVTYECPCADQWKAYVYLAHCGVGLDYARLGWKDLHLPGEHPVKVAIEGYLNASEPFVRAGVGMIFTGTSGAGKTMMATLLLKLLLARGYDGYFTRFNEAVDLFMSGWREPEEKRQFHRRIKNSEILVLDDVGREHKGRIEQTSETVEEVLRHRVANAMPTIITTNKTAEQLARDYGVFSLISVSMEPVVFEEAPFWEQKRGRNVEEARMGLVRPIEFT